MADYIYLLENRLSSAQRAAVRTVRELARGRNLTVFLVGGAVRDLTSGSPVRDLDVVVQGNALKLKAELEKAGAVITGELTAAQSLFVAFPGSVRMEVGSTLSVTWPKPGKPVYKPANILDDLRRRDFTANAMALSLNEGSYGLLMDPLNGIADIENRELRLVSNYGFIEDPVRMVRAARLMARLGWALDEKTQQRYETGKAESYITALSEQQRGYELEEIVHEEDPYRVVTRLEAEGWLKVLAPYWTAAKADVPALEHLREVQTQLQMQGIHPDASAANFPLLTAKLGAKELTSLKSSFVRQGFVAEIDSLERKAKDLSTLLTGKAATLPSQTWQLLMNAAPEAVLWVAFSSRSAAIQAKLKSFLTVWPQARQKIPYALMQEMRIVPELPGYEDLLGKLFFELMDEKLQLSEEMKAYLEPYSPPAPPPPVNTRRPRASKKEAKGKGRAKKALAIDLEDEAESGDGELPDEVEAVLTDAILDALAEAPVAETGAAAVANDLLIESVSRPEATDAAVMPSPAAKTTSETSSKPKQKLKPKREPEPVPAPVSESVAIKKATMRKAVPLKAESLKAASATKAESKPVAATKSATTVPAPSRTAGTASGVSRPRRPLVQVKPAVKRPAKPLSRKASAKPSSYAPAKQAKKAAPAGKAVAKTVKRPDPKVLAKKVPAKKVVATKVPARKQPPPAKTASKKKAAKSVPPKKRR